MNVVLYRILGNPLPPRHDSRNTLENLRFVLDNEEDLPGCEKRWILNGIVDDALSRACRQLIEQAGHACMTIPFDREPYRRSFLDGSGLPPLQAGQALPPMQARLRHEWIYRHKSLAAINLNRARNAAIDAGRRDADWVLPLDGGTFFKSDDWQEFTEALRQAPDACYALIPMYRLEANEGFREMDASQYMQEPQIAFRRDAPDRFDERLRYGHRDKSELLARLQAPGPWHNWTAAAWENETPLTAVAPGRFIEAGRLYRLQSGAETEVETKESVRHQARFRGVADFTAAIDADLLERRMAELGRTPWILPAAHPALLHTTPAALEARLAYAIMNPPGTEDTLLLPLLAETWLADGTVSQTDYDRIKERLGALLTALEETPTGQAANRGGGVTGTRTHLLKAALALFLRQDAAAARLLHNATLRLVLQCAAPPAAGAPQNIAVWLLLARLGAMAGIDLAAYRGVNGESIDALAETARAAYRAAGSPSPHAIESAWALLDGMRRGNGIPPEHPGIAALAGGMPAHWPVFWEQWPS